MGFQISGAEPSSAVALIAFVLDFSSPGFCKHKRTNPWIAVRLLDPWSVIMLQTVCTLAVNMPMA